uniref:Uncharacterized protein n=1 Tax=Zeugodacus cucurbitae TaxID=28588 RepID=A0A0A1WMX3_ZEUCU
MPRKKLLNAMSERKKRQDITQDRQQILNSPDSKQDNSTTTIDTSNDQPVVVIKSENFDSDDDIPLTQVKRHLNTNDDFFSKRRKLEQPVYIKPEECSSSSPPQYIKTEEFTEGSNPEVIDNFIIYEINEVNSSNELNTKRKSGTILKSQKPEIAEAQCLPPAHSSENLTTVWTISKVNRTQNATQSKNSTTNAKMSNRTNTKIHNFSELPGTSSSKQKASSVRKIATTKVHDTPIRKVITSFDEVTNKCTCRLNPMKNVDMFSNLELKDFFERMFEEARKLKIEARQTVKTELLKAVSQAEEDVEAGKFCEKCYTIRAQPKKRY